jgi:hypothetical protein
MPLLGENQILLRKTEDAAMESGAWKAGWHNEQVCGVAE